MPELTLTRRWRLLPATILLLACGCSSSPPAAQLDRGPQATPAPAPAALAQLPSPPEMLARLEPASAAGPRAASYTESDLARDGDEFEAALPNNRVTADDPPKLEFQSQWAGPGSALGDAAYCVYHFAAPDYDRDPRLLVGWSSSLEGSEWAVGLSRWGAKRWDWYAGTDSHWLELATLAPYFDYGGHLLAVVVCLRDGGAMLSGLRLGGRPPVAEIEANVSEGPTPLHVTLDASASTPGDGSIVHYAWDLDGDFVYETDGGSTSTCDATYAQTGGRWAGVRVTSSINASDTASVYIRSIGRWEHTWGLAGVDSLTAVAIADNGTLYAAGKLEFPPGSGNSNLLLISVSPLGELNWARLCDLGSRARSYGLGLSSDGTLVLAGSLLMEDEDLLLQKWTLAGALVWSYRYGGTGIEQPWQLITDGTDIYVCGETSSTASTDDDYFACHFHPDGLPHWGVGRDSGGRDTAYGLGLRRSLDGTVTGTIVIGTARGAAPDNVPRAWKLELNTTGGLASGSELGAPAWEATGRSVAFDASTQQCYVAGELIEDGQSRPYVHASDPGGICQFATRWWWSSIDCTVWRLRLDPADGLLLAGWWQPDSDSCAALWQFTADDGTAGQLRYCDADPGVVHAIDLVPTEYGVALAGYAPHTGASWIGLDGNSSGFGVNWEDAPGSGRPLLWTWTTETPTAVLDITGEMAASADSGAGVDEAWLAHRLL